MAREANEDLSKIPKWAQNRIKTLEMQVANNLHHIMAISQCHLGTNVQINQNLVYPNIDLEPFSEILFYMGDGRGRWQDVIEVRIPRSDPTQLEVRGTDKHLTIQPTSYNSFTVRLKER